MSQYIDILTLTVTAAGPIAANRFVTAAGAQGTADAHVLGVARSAAANAGEAVPVIALGTAVVEAGGAISAGDPISCDADGRAVPTDGGTYSVTVARALADAGPGQPVEVLVIPN